MKKALKKMDLIKETYLKPQFYIRKGKDNGMNKENELNIK